MNSKFVQSKKEKIANYDPNEIYTNSGLFGLPFNSEESEVVIIPIPWEVTVSFREGTALGPKAISEASYQVDLYDADIQDAWTVGISMEPISRYWTKKNNDLRLVARKCIKNIEEGGKAKDKKVVAMYKKINSASRELNAWVKKESLKFLEQDKLVGVVGGDHSSPLGLMEALGEKYPKYSILHIDAHADYREGYEGFDFSHASIQYNAGKLPCVENQVLFGIRDFSEREAELIAKSNKKIVNYTDRILKANTYKGITWEAQCQEITKQLSNNVYISFDIDALNPSMCPHTGTPVPSGLEYEQVFHLFNSIIKSGKKIIGFDLCEVAPGKSKDDNTDAVVGARALYRLSLLMAKSQGKI